MFQPPVQASGAQGVQAAPVQGQSERPSEGMQERRAPSASGAPFSAAHILQLQKTVGNRAVTQMLRQQEARRQMPSSAAQASSAIPAQMVLQRNDEDETDVVRSLGIEIYQQLKTSYITPELKEYGVDMLLETFFKVADNFILSLFPALDQAVKMLFGFFSVFRQVANYWVKMNPNLRAGIKYVIGLVVNKFDQFISDYTDKKLLGLYESFAAYDAEFLRTLESCIEKLDNFEKQFLDRPGLAKKAAGKLVEVYQYLRQKWSGQSPEEQPSGTPQQEQSVGADRPSVVSGPAKGDKSTVTTVDLKLVKVDLQNLTIAESTHGPLAKKGGLDSKNRVTFRLFGNEYTIDEIHARLDWDLNWSIDATFRDKQIVGHSQFLMFELEQLILNKLNVGNTGLNELAVSIGKFKAGSLLELNQVYGQYQKGVGFAFGAGEIALNLPQPLDTAIKARAQLLLDKDGAFKSVELNNFQIGKKVAIKRAQLTTEHLHIQELEYNFGSGTNKVKPVLYDLLINKDKKILSVRGGVEVKDWELVNGLVLDGRAYVGYKDQFQLGVENAKIRLDQKFVHGYGSIKRLQYNEDHTFEGQIERLAFSVGVFALDAENVEINKDGSLRIAEAEAVLGKQDKVSSKDLEAMGKGGGKDSLMSSLNESRSGGGLASLAQVHLKAIGITIKDGEYKVERYEKWIGPNKVYKISLLGGAVQGMIDQEKKKANISGQLEFPKNRAFWPLKLHAALPVPPTPLSLFVEVGIGGSVKAMVAGEIAKDQEHEADSLYNVAGMAHLEGNLKFSVGAGVKIGSELLIALKAYLEASATLRAAATAEVSGQVRLNPATNKMEQDDRKPVEFAYNLEGDLIAKIEALVDFVAFLVYQKNLYTKTLGSWTLGKYKMSGKVAEQAGQLEDQVVTPKPVNGEDKTLGGALPGALKLPENHAVEQLMHWNEPIEKLKGNDKLPDDKHAMYRTAHDMMDNDFEIDQQKVNDVQSKLERVAKKPSKVGPIAQDAGKDVMERLNGIFPSFLMTKAEWIKYSTTESLTGITTRRTIEAVDNLLASYHQEQDLNNRLKQLNDLRKVLNEYLKQKGKSRKPMVLKLLFETGKEEEMLNEFIKFNIMAL
ncbi:hypothetical protein EV586_101583 [Tumebacillus sp. BK434]|uniref:hypothetical protein n=1 Tax=Tumebacillus sp. BK434 TaxID=2512169 RepID=UPI001051EF29|nr:hypothetical protein [Tumebacillus sp. BK434]TCP59367.1 hypothetical protein EV586_101583 [Tumebacillus sp. BK434]